MGRGCVRLRGGKETLLVPLEMVADVWLTLPLCSSPSLLKQRVSGLSQQAQLSVLGSLQPVSERGADAAKQGESPQSVALENGAHLNAELPDADGDA